jgi:hypothetical protein
MKDETGTSGRTGRPGISVRAVEAIVAAIVFSFGAIFTYTSYRLGYRWGADGPQSGFFPFYVSLAICAASAVVLIRATFAGDDKSKETFVERDQLKQVLSVLIPAAIFVLGIQLIGIYVSSAVYITLFMRKLGKYSWIKSVSLGVSISVAFFVMFEVWFKVSLYKGYWNLTGWTGY